MAQKENLRRKLKKFKENKLIKDIHIQNQTTSSGTNEIASYLQVSPFNQEISEKSRISCRNKYESDEENNNFGNDNLTPQNDNRIFNKFNSNSTTNFYPNTNYNNKFHSNKVLISINPQPQSTSKFNNIHQNPLNNQTNQNVTNQKKSIFKFKPNADFPKRHAYL